LSIALIMVAALYLNFKLPPMYRTSNYFLIGSVLSAVILISIAVVNGWGLADKLVAMARG
ncbi:MAG: hypothetical protein CME15_07680, partial [Gemmatimonadetes bacterium]|nr:hypothetical protein [Gemmatimonadota bacterium]